MLFKSLLPILSGFFFLMIGHGLQTSIIPVRANLEHFDLGVISLIMSSYYLGFFVATRFVSNFIEAIGHIRAFAVLSALISFIILLYALWVDPIVWIIIRFFIGMTFTGIFLIVESWLNDFTNNKNRGIYLSFYILLTNVGFTIGYYGILLVDVKEFYLFSIASIVISFASLPILIAAKKQPKIMNPEKLSFKVLYLVSPVGALGIIFVGLSAGSNLSLSAVYALSLNFTQTELANFIVTGIICSFTLLYPVGIISDLIDRRYVILTLTIIATLSALIISIEGSPSLYLNAFYGLFMATTTPLYSLCLSHINDHLNPNQRVSAGNKMLASYSLGTILGSLLGTLFMVSFGAYIFFIFMASIMLVFAIFVFYRIRIQKHVWDQEQRAYYAAIPTQSVVTPNILSDWKRSLKKSKNIKNIELKEEGLEKILEENELYEENKENEKN